MRQQNFRKVRRDKASGRGYVVRDEIRYWAPEGATCVQCEQVFVLNPTTRSAMVKRHGRIETWMADATSDATSRQ